MTGIQVLYSVLAGLGLAAFMVGTARLLDSGSPSSGSTLRGPGPTPVGHAPTAEPMGQQVSPAPTRKDSRPTEVAEPASPRSRAAGRDE